MEEIFTAKGQCYAYVTYCKITNKQRWSPQGRPRGHILKSLALKPQVLGLEALGPRKLPCPRLEDSTVF